MTIAHDIHNHNRKPKVAVALSGGVDSAVSAALLKEQGYEVVGFFMKNWSDDKQGSYRLDQCPWIQDYEDVKRICAHLDIPYHTFNFEEEYRAKVFQYFLDEYDRGRTPNPDVLCNTEIKFKSFLEKTQQLGFEYVATGHYARLRRGGFGGQARFELLKGVDPNKDQSYFIYHLDQAQLSKILFPIGDLQKSQVRELASKFNLPVAKKPDSQGLCFIGEINFQHFLEQYLPQKPGQMVDVAGKVMGEHRGLQYYTIGQRYGLNIGGTGPYYVAEKNIQDNTLIICQGADHPSLFSSWFTISDPFWIDPDFGGSMASPGTHMPWHVRTKKNCSVKIRYRSPDIACTIQDNKVILNAPGRAITPGQFAVFYDGDVVLGGAVIQEREVRL